MSNELERQRMILTDFKAYYGLGSFAKKQNAGGLIAGFADLKVASMVTGTWEFEVKYWSSRPRGGVKLPLTELQRQYGRECQAAGIRWGWIAVFKDGVTNLIAAGDDPSQLVIDPNVWGRVRKRGGGWEDYNPIDQIETRRGS